jgi:hypothetical protein
MRVVDLAKRVHWWPRISLVALLLLHGAVE